ncbi:zinc finger protein 541 isoform X1 [Grammomys surdaster]|uniref:zinc finger protein 541 isoform X1 n=1 Tax=Grammomys surdaster TaxID=491861 RepID=UPI00109FCEC8|nr:zinc finger protein 541 isoform X1 [Grammomys surdaster]
MEPYSLGEEGALPSEGHLPPFSESQGLNCSDTLNRDLGPSTRDLLYAGLSGLDLDPSLSTSDMPSEVLEDNLDSLSLYSGKDSDSVKLLEEYADSESQTSLQDLGLGALKVPKEADEGGRATGSTRKGKRQHSSPQNPLLDCSLCGKVFSSASSLSKHYLTHSQERKHVCKVCSKAFKRQDHLTGHMLTHQKTKPFVCIEQGCSKSYCDYRSLRRHYEVQHGVCILKEAPPEEEAYGDPTHNHDVPNQPPPSGLRSLGPSEARSPGSVLPNRDLLRCIVSSIVHQKIPSPGPAVGPSDTEARSSACACPTTLGSSSCTPASTPVAPGTLGSEISEETHPPRKEAATEVFTGVQSRATENGDPDPPESELESESPRLQRPSSLEGWPEASSLPACLPLFRGHSVPSGSQPSSHNFQWLRNLPGCPKNKGSNVFMVHKTPAVASREGSEGGSGPSSTPTSVEPSPSLGTSQEDLLPFPPALLKAPGEASSEVRQGAGEDESWAPKKCKPDCESFPWQSPTELGLQDAQNPGGLPSDATPLFRQLFMKSQESLVSHEQMQVLQMIAKSQRIFSHTQVATASAQRPGPEGKQSTLKPLQGPWPPQTLPPVPTVDSFQIGPGHSEPEGSPVRRRKTMPAVSRETSPGGPRRDTKGGPKVASAPPSLTGPALHPSRNPDSSSLAKGTLDLGDIIPSAGSRQSQLGGDEPAGTQLVGKQGQGENGLASGVMRGEKGPACPRGGGYRLFSGHPRAQRFSGFRKEKVKMDVCCAASPSQVAMASFSSAGPVPDPPRDMKSKLTIFNRIQGGNIYRLPHPVKEESLAGGCHQPNGGPTDWMESKSTFVCKNCSQMFYTEKGLSSHMCFHSDQWPSPRGKQEQQGQEKDGEERDSKESSQYRKRKKRPQPKALFAPPAPSVLGEPGPGGCHQSCLRSPVFLVDHLLKGLFQCSPYTPPPMLSPIREGSGLYFNTLCSTSRAGPHLISPVLDQVDGSFGICVVKDDTKISIEPHINVGSRFQAEIPELQEKPLARVDENVASLVWKPWGDVMTNPETQDRVMELCNVACSSVMPGGGTNLELALHCLHDAQGSVQVALETLLLRGPQKPRTHPLADYRYTGSDIWTPMEKRLFKKAFCAHKKDFYLIHKTGRSMLDLVLMATVWLHFGPFTSWKDQDPCLCPAMGRDVGEGISRVEFTCKVTCSPRERPTHRPTPELKIKTKSYRRESILHSSPSAAPKRTPEPPGSVESQGVFPCRECERVFDKIKSRNAHMKRHRLQEHVEPVRVKWPVKPYPLKEEEEEEEEELGADMGPLQW